VTLRFDNQSQYEIKSPWNFNRKINFTHIAFRNSDNQTNSFFQVISLTTM